MNRHDSEIEHEKEIIIRKKEIKSESEKVFHYVFTLNNIDDRIKEVFKLQNSEEVKIVKKNILKKLTEKIAKDCNDNYIAEDKNKYILLYNLMNNKFEKIFRENVFIEDVMLIKGDSIEIYSPNKELIEYHKEKIEDITKNFNKLMLSLEIEQNKNKFLISGESNERSNKIKRVL